MGIAALRHWKGALSIIVASATPFVAWASGECTLRGAIISGVVAGLSAASTWVNSSISDALAEKAAEKEVAVASAQGQDSEEPKS